MDGGRPGALLTPELAQVVATEFKQEVRRLSEDAGQKAKRISQKLAEVDKHIETAPEPEGAETVLQ